MEDTEDIQEKELKRLIKLKELMELQKHKNENIRKGLISNFELTNKINPGTVTSVQLNIGDNQIDKHYTEWLNIWSELNNCDENNTNSKNESLSKPPTIIPMDWFDDPYDTTTHNSHLIKDKQCQKITDKFMQQYGEWSNILSNSSEPNENNDISDFALIYDIINEKSEILSKSTIEVLKTGDLATTMHNKIILPELSKEKTNDFFDDPYDNTSIKKSQLINIYRPVGINTINTDFGNKKNYNIKGLPPNPKIAISPWQNSSYEPDMDLKNQKICY